MIKIRQNSISAHISNQRDAGAEETKVVENTVNVEATADSATAIDTNSKTVIDNIPKTTKTKSVNLPKSEENVNINDFIVKRKSYSNELSAAGYNPYYQTAGENTDLRIKAIPMVLYTENSVGMMTPKEQLESKIDLNKDRAQFLQGERSKRLNQISIMQNILSDQELLDSDRSVYEGYLQYLRDRLAVIDKTISAWPALYQSWKNELAAMEKVNN